MKQAQTYIRFILFAFSALLTACSSEQFPGCCDPTGNRDAPFQETFLFDFKTGSGPITKDNPGGNLQIISQADLRTLLAAAQDSQLVGTGIVSGLVHFNGAPAQDVALKVTDGNGRLLAIRMEGKRVGSDFVLPDGTVCPPENIDTINGICSKGSIYYNNPGGVPDFSNVKGTSSSGTFTIFNLPEGDIYVWASRGGRGSARIKVFKDKISVGKIPVLPFPVSTVGVTGTVLEGSDETTAISGATVSILGNGDPGMTVASSSIGQYFIPSIGTNGAYLMKVNNEGYWPTYHFLSTAPFQDAVVPDVTKSPTLYSEGHINQIAAGKVAVDRNLGVITGRVKGGDGTPQECARLTVTDAAGTDIGTGRIVYIDETDKPPLFGRETCAVPGDKNQTSGNGLFYLFNLPEGEIFITYRTDPQSAQTPPTNVITGGVVTTSFPGVALVQDLFNSGSNQRPALSGQVRDEKEQPVAGGQLTVLGAPGLQATVSGTGYSFPAGRLVGGTVYRIKSSKAGLPDTYQFITQADKETGRDLILASSDLAPAPGAGTIYGTIINQLTGRLAEKVHLKVTYLDGSPAGPGEAFSSDGHVTIPNIPAGAGGTIVNLAVASGDDSGNIFLRVYPDGVTVIDFVMAKVPPARVSYSGSVRDLAGQGVAAAQVKILGRSDTVSTDAAGTFSANLESFGRFIIKTEKEGFHNTYNFFPATGMRNLQNAPPLFSVPRSQTTLQTDSRNGIVAGAALRYDLKQENCAVCTAQPGPHASVIGFFDNDTVADMAFTSPGTPGTVTVLYGDGNGNFKNPRTLGVGDGPRAVGTGDFNADGRADLVVLNGGSNDISVFLGDKNGNFTLLDLPLVDKEKKPLPPTLTSPVAMVVGLFDSDTILDLAIVDRTELLVFVGNGNGTFSPKLQNDIPERKSLGSAPTGIVAGDFNADSRLDLAVSNSASATISVFLGNTTGTFESLSDPNTSAPTVVGTAPNPQAMVLADLNADGRLDLAVAHPAIDGSQTGKVSILLGNAGGGFDPLKTADGNLVLASVGAGGALLSGITVGDFNEDNRVDLAVANKNGNSVTLLYGNGDGRFTSTREISLGPSFLPDTVTLADSNLDGLFDLTFIGAGVATLLGREEAIEGVSVEARNMEGVRVGTVRYLNASGEVDPGLTATGSGGGFIIFDVPPGITGVRSTNGGPGNRLIDVYPDSVSYTKIKTISSQPSFVSVNGVTYDPVGPPPAGVPIGSVNIHLLGIDLRTKSDPVTGNYLLPGVDANSEFIVKLFWDLPANGSR